MLSGRLLQALFRHRVLAGAEHRYVLAHDLRTVLDIPGTLASDPSINEAFGLINEAAMSREELEIQFKRRDFIILQRGSLALAESKGREAGREGVPYPASAVSSPRSPGADPCFPFTHHDRNALNLAPLNLLFMPLFPFPLSL